MLPPPTPPDSSRCDLAKKLTLLSQALPLYCRFAPQEVGTILVHRTAVWGIFYSSRKGSHITVETKCDASGLTYVVFLLKNLSGTFCFHFIRKGCNKGLCWSAARGIEEENTLNSYRPAALASCVMKFCIQHGQPDRTVTKLGISKFIHVWPLKQIDETFKMEKRLLLHSDT